MPENKFVRGPAPSGLRLVLEEPVCEGSRFTNTRGTSNNEWLGIGRRRVGDRLVVAEFVEMISEGTMGDVDEVARGDSVRCKSIVEIMFQIPDAEGARGVGIGIRARSKRLGPCDVQEIFFLHRRCWWLI